jgi:hypothetical protein
VSDSPTLRQSIAQLATRQWGHVTRAQLLTLGVSVTTIDARVRDGRLIPVYRGVYAVGYRREDPIARACAAVLACGPGAVLSHDSALALWGLRRWPRVHEVITPGCVRRPGIRAHRSQTLTRAQTTVQFGIPVTRAARALRDMRRRLTSKQLVRLTNQARLDHILSAEEAEALLGHDRNPTRSGLEDELQRWFERYDVPQAVINVRPGGHEVDAHYPDQRVILEVDDYATHGDRASFQRDRDRDFEHLVALDTVTVRLTRDRFDESTARAFKELLRRRTPAALRPAAGPRPS